MAIPTSKDIKYWLFLAVFIIITVAFLRLLLPFVAPLILSAIIVSIFTPVYYFFNRWLPQSVASFICCVLICVIIFIPFVIIITILANQALTLYSNAMESEFMQNLTAEVDSNWVVAQVNQLLDRFGIGITISGKQIHDFIEVLSRRFVAFLYGQATNVTSNFIRLVINFCFMILISFYLFGNGRRVINFFVGLSPLPEGHEVAVLQRLKTTAGAIFFGSFISGVIQGTIGGLTLWYFGFPAPFLWAVVMIILAFLPIVGIGLVFIPCIVITFAGGDIVHGIAMAVIYVASSSITEYIIIPRIQGKRSHMHTVFIFLSVLGGLQMFGIIGVLYGPLIITAFLALYEIYRANYVDAPDIAVTPSGVVAVVPNNVEPVTADDVANRALRGMETGTDTGAAPTADMNPVVAAPLAGVGVTTANETSPAVENDNNIALGDDIEPEFHENTGLPVDEDILDTSIFGNTDDDAPNNPLGVLSQGFGAGKGDLQDYPGHNYVDYPGGDPPLACSDEIEAEPDGLIWDEDRPAHLPFPKAEGADRLVTHDDADDPDVSIKDIVRADITSFETRAENIKNEEDSSGDKTTKE